MSAVSSSERIDVAEPEGIEEASGAPSAQPAIGLEAQATWSSDGGPSPSCRPAASELPRAAAMSA